MARKIVIFQNFEHLKNLNLHIFFRLPNTNQFYYCFLLDITCTLVPAIELVSIWCTLDRMSISVSILHSSLENRNNCKASTIQIC